MAYDRIIYTTPEQQLEKLKSQNLQISNEKFALDNLRTFGYSNLIKSYRDPYTYIENSKKRYRSGIAFICENTDRQNQLSPNAQKSLVLAWDPDFTKVTPAERAELEEAKKEIENGETVSHDDINWL